MEPIYPILPDNYPPIPITFDSKTADISQEIFKKMLSPHGLDRRKTGHDLGKVFVVMGVSAFAAGTILTFTTNPLGSLLIVAGVVMIIAAVYLLTKAYDRDPEVIQEKRNGALACNFQELTQKYCSHPQLLAPLYQFLTPFEIRKKLHEHLIKNVSLFDFFSLKFDILLVCTAGGEDNERRLFTHDEWKYLNEVLAKPRTLFEEKKEELKFYEANYKLALHHLYQDYFWQIVSDKLVIN